VVTLTAGTRLGPYEIVSLLGTDDMGEAYRARDPRLKRDVAIKVLPESTAADPERRARLEREAQSVAALSQPNIVTIYSVEDVDGVLCLTMEYVDGNQSEVIVKGGLSLTQINRESCSVCLAFEGRLAAGTSQNGHLYISSGEAVNVVCPTSIRYPSGSRM
jgi:eukaryotic-like serine/threonine-protein kinase